MYKAIFRFEKMENGVFIKYPDKVTKFCVEQELEKCDEFCVVTFQKRYRSRTTGEGSQNNLFWKLATMIANESGEDLHEIEKTLKEKAISKGYPYHYSKITGSPVPESMTKINTVEMSYLIDTAYEVCAFLGIQVGE